MKDTKCPCVANALFGMKAITVDGKTVGIARLCDAIASVQAMDLSGDDRIKEALLMETEKENYIPGSLRAAYANALLSEYRAAIQKSSPDMHR
jgi:hypothetical protein